MKMKFNLSALLLVISIAGQNATAATKAKNCKVTFKTIGKPVLVQIDGTSGHPCVGSFEMAGNDLKNASFKMQLDKLETGIALRNKHLRENYLHVDKYPDSTLTIDTIPNFAASVKEKSGAKLPFTPKLTLHGVTKEVKGATYFIEGNVVTSEFRVELLDYGVERPSFMGVKVVDAVIIKVAFEL